VLGDDLGGREITDSEKEAVTALCAAGALVGAILAGITSDKYGRKPAIWFASVLFVRGMGRPTHGIAADLHDTDSLSAPSSKQRPSISHRCALGAFLSVSASAVLA